MFDQLRDPMWLIKSLLIFLGYFVAAELAFSWYTPPAIFPISSGIALAGVVLGGFWMAPAIFIAGITVYFLHDAPLLLGFAVAFSNTLQALIGAYALQRLQFDPLLRRMRDIFSLAGVAIVVSIVVPTIMAIAFDINARLGGNTVPISWIIYWIGHMWTLLIIAPFFIRWFAKPFFVRTRNEVFETILAFVLLGGVNYLVFFSETPSVGGISFAYLLLIPLFWIALRMSTRFLTLALVVMSLFAFLGVAFGPSAATTAAAIGQRLFQVEVFLIVFALIFYIVASIATERRHAVEALRTQVRKLEGALNRISSEDLAKTEFLSVLAHELRNPLAPIMSGLELIRLKGARTPEGGRIIEMMSGRVHVMRRLLDDLLDVSRISRKKLQLKKEDVYLQKLLRGSIAAVNELSIQKTHRCELTLPAEPLHMEGDPVRLEQILVNLLKNAVKFTPPGGSVLIRLERENDMATIRIRDTGIGIDPGMLGSIFEPFVQADPGKAEHGGTGLGIGLALTKMLVEMHGGTIEAKSEGIGRGSEFVVRFLLLHDIAKKIPEAPAQESVARAKRSPSKVLVVDDNIYAAEGMGRLLEHRGHRTDMAFSGMDAITRAKVFQPDVILLDIGLPDMSGYEVARVLRSADNYSGKLIALTGYGQEEDKNRAYDAGFDYHLTKPVSVNDVEAVLNR